MSLKSLRFSLSLGLLLLGLSLASLPAEASPAAMGRTVSVTDYGKGAGVLSALRAFLAALWPGDAAREKEGMSIDPDGRTTAGAVSGDEGVTIDPDGAK